MSALEQLTVGIIVERRTIDNPLQETSSSSTHL